MYACMCCFFSPTKKFDIDLEPRSHRGREASRGELATMLVASHGKTLIVGSLRRVRPVLPWSRCGVTQELELLPLKGLGSHDDGCLVVLEEVFVGASLAYIFCI
ncbi:hypothetical protein VPH35_035815 [Triticum aestivum]